MAYSREIFIEAMAELEQRRQKATDEANALRTAMTARQPRLAEIEKTLAQTGNKLAAAILSGGDITNAVNAIKNENLLLQQEMAELLKGLGCQSVNFEPHYSCPNCNDTGYANGAMCECLAALLKDKAARQVCHGFTAQKARFEDMDLSFYENTAPTGQGISPRARMQQILHFCKQYACQFDRNAPSLLLRGATGTGKTHTSLAMASIIAEQGFSVLYQPAGKLFSILEREHFGKQDGDTEGLALSCDLLIIDDLGTEFDTSFSVATLYNIINTRMLDGLPTIVSTNLTQEGLQERYGDQITSRITGAFEPLLFVGKDIRQQKRTRSMSHT